MNWSPLFKAAGFWRHTAVSLSQALYKEPHRHSQSTAKQKTSNQQTKKPRSLKMRKLIVVNSDTAKGTFSREHEAYISQKRERMEKAGEIRPSQTKHLGGLPRQHINPIPSKAGSATDLRRYLVRTLLSAARGVNTQFSFCSPFKRGVFPTSPLP